MRRTLDTPAPFSFRRFVAAVVPPVAFLLVSVVPTVPSGPVTGTGQDEWYNVVRGLTALYERLDPSYFIHPALYYDVMALLFAVDRALLAIAGALGGKGYLDYFVAHQQHFLQLARWMSVACGALAVATGVWLGTLLAGAGAGLLVGLILASLPLLRMLSVAVRVDTLALATFLGATALLVRAHQARGRRSIVLACIGIGVAAAANYPGALLLLLFAWFVHLEPGWSSNTWRLAAGTAVAFAVFIAATPYALMHLRTFLAWFSFQAGTAFATHPHGPDPSTTQYLNLLRAQGFPAILACMAGVAAALTPREPGGAIALLAIAYLAVFSAIQSQYDRFALPPIALLCVAGPSWLCLRLTCRIGPRVGAATSLILAAGLVWYAAGHNVFFTQPSASPDADYRTDMLEWIHANVPRTATLIFESDTLPLLQTVYAPGDSNSHFHRELLRAFERMHPDFPAKILKAQFINTVYNYDPELLNDADAYFLGSSQNRDYVLANRTRLRQPAAFYDALDATARVVHESGGVHERLALYQVRRR